MTTHAQILSKTQLRYMIVVSKVCGTYFRCKGLTVVQGVQCPTMGDAIPQVLAVFTYLQLAVVLFFSMVWLAHKAKHIALSLQDVLNDDIGRLEDSIENLATHCGIDLHAREDKVKVMQGETVKEDAGEMQNAENDGAAP